MPPHLAGLADQQGWEITDLRPHRQGRPHRSESDRSTATYLQALLRSHGATTPQAFDPIGELTRKAAEGHQEPDQRPPTAKLPEGHPELRRARGQAEGLHLGPPEQGKYMCFHWCHGQRER